MNSITSNPLNLLGGDDETRTRDLRRDRTMEPSLLGQTFATLKKEKMKLSAERWD
ncbi:MAG: hypothetical protein ACLP3B_23270 [Syntrophobacteraceae bacterium]